MNKSILVSILVVILLSVSFTSISALSPDNEKISPITPLKQIKTGILAKDVRCKISLVLIQKHDGTPVCVKPETKTKLIERRWAAISDQLGEKEAINLIKNQYPQFQDFPSNDLPPKIIRAAKSSNGWYVIFETQGSGIPIIEAECFLVDNSKTVIQIGQYKNAGDMKTNISFKTCS